MANKFLDQNGLLYLWQKITSKFVAKETGKGLSSNDYTTDEKVKLGGIDTAANKTTITDNLLSDSGTEALSAKQGKVLDGKITDIRNSMSDLGYGDMMKATYDTDNNGKVDKADNADKLGGQTPDYYAKKTDLFSGSYNDLTDKPTDFAPGEHSHDDRYYTEAEVDSKLSGKADSNHIHNDYATTSELLQVSSAKADKNHKHEISDVNNLEQTLATYGKQVEDQIENVIEIAQGKRKSYVFDTEADLNTWLANDENTAGLATGDAFLIRAVNVPDYWWDGSAKQILETAKIEIPSITYAEIDSIVTSTNS